MVSFNSTLGPLFGSLFASALLYGISAAQFIVYARKCEKDKLYLKLLVLSIAILDTIHLGLVAHDIYVPLVVWHSNPKLTPVWPSSGLNPPFTVLNNSLVRLFFSYRIWQFSGKKYLVPSIISVFSLSAMASEFYFGISMDIRKGQTWTVILQNAKWSIYCGLGTEILADTIILVYMVWLLKSRKFTDFSSTNSVINSLMVFTIHTGLFTVLCSFFTLLLFSIMPGDLIFMTFYLVLCQIYTNSLLGMLNARMGLRTKLGGTKSSLLQIPNEPRQTATRSFPDESHELRVFSAQTKVLNIQ